METALVQLATGNSFTTIALTGALGSGKSALVEHVFSGMGDRLLHDKCGNVDKCTEKTFTFFNLKFTRGFGGVDAKDIVREFRREYFNRLRSILEHHFRDESVIEFLVQKIRVSNGGDFSNFDGFLRDHVDRSTGTKWNNLTISGKAATLFNWVERENEGGRFSLWGLKLLAYLASLVKELKSSYDGCMVMVFDNIDRLEPDEAQNQILVEIISLADISKIRTVVTVRQTAYGWLVGSNSYEFETFPHAGQSPIDIVRKRLSGFLEKREGDADLKLLVNGMSEEFLAAFVKRATLVSETFVGANRLTEMFENLAGNSIRRGLRLAERFFRSGVLRWDDSNPSQDELARCLIIGSEESCRHRLNDHLVVNIFSDPQSGRPALVCLRILQLLRAEERRTGEALSTGNLISHLRRFDGTDTAVFTAAFNRLVSVGARLIWIDCVNQYPDSGELVRSYNDTCNLSITGDNYVSKLVFDLPYVQEMFAAIDWPEKVVAENVDCSKLSERFSFVRSGLIFFLNLDRKETQRYRSGVGSGGSLIDYLISARMIAEIAVSVFRILGNVHVGKEGGYVNRREYARWYELLLRASGASVQVLGVEDVAVFRSISMYENRFDIKDNESRAEFLKCLVGRD